jgi:hypothetical protein
VNEGQSIVKLYFVEVDDEGQSYVARAEDVASDKTVYLWRGSIGQAPTPRGRSDAEDRHLSLGPGGLAWIRGIVPPSDLTEITQIPMHNTFTVDFDHVISGPVQCVLDKGTVELQSGDSIVLRGANHTWVNPGEHDAVLLYALLEPQPIP